MKKLDIELAVMRGDATTLASEAHRLQERDKIACDALARISECDLSPSGALVAKRRAKRALREMEESDKMQSVFRLA